MSQRYQNHGPRFNYTAGIGLGLVLLAIVLGLAASRGVVPVPSFSLVGEPTRTPTPGPSRTATRTPHAEGTTVATMTAQATLTGVPSASSTATGNANSTPTSTISSTVVAGTSTTTPSGVSTPTPSNTAQSSATPTQLAITGPVHYVSKLGSNAGGGSWASAWNELASINWAVVRPGDTVLVASGTYTTALIPKASGTSSAPIRVLAQGQVVMFGGRTVNGQWFQLPEADFYTASNPPPAYTIPLNVGIDLGGVSNFIIDGGKWSGIKVYGFGQSGLKFGGSSNNVAKFLEIYDDGAIYLNGPSQSYRTRLPCMAPGGTNNTIDHVISRDCGEDSLQTGSSFSNFTIRSSWLSNTRSHSKYSGNVPWNAQSHPDGMQVYGNITPSGVTIDGSVIGPGAMQGTILGQSGSSLAIVSNVVIRNTLFINDFNSNIMGYGGSPSQNWTIDHVTLFMESYPRNYVPGLLGWSHTIYLEGSGHKLTNSILYGGDVTMPAGSQFSNNCQFGLTGGPTVGTNADPGFVRKPLNTSLADSAAADFRATNPACSGRGSSITSVAALLAQ